MAKDKTQSTTYEGHQEYPKYLGEGNTRRIVNNEVEEDEFYNQNPDTEAPAKSANAWASKDSKKS